MCALPKRPLRGICRAMRTYFNKGIEIVLLVAALLGGCEPMKPTTAKLRRENPEFVGGPTPLKEAEQLARRSVKGFDTDDRQLTEAFENRIVTLLAHREPLRRAKAAGELGELRRTQGVEALLLAAGAGEPDRTVRLAAVEAIGWVGQKDCALPIAARLHDPAAEVRIAAARVLGRLGNREATEPLIGALEDPDEHLRAAAAAALGWLRDERGLEPLIRALGDHRGKVRAAAGGALGLLGEKAAVAPLIRALKDSDPLVRYLAAGALGRLGDRRAAGPLETLRKDPDPSVRKAAQSALTKLKG